MYAKRILIVEVNWLGDVLFSTPFIRSVRKNFPEAFIACMVVPGCKTVLDGNPNINEIIIYNERENMEFVKKLRGYNFDTVFFLHRSFTRAFLVWLAGIKQRIGFYTLKRGFLLTQKPRPPKINAQHRAKFYLGLLEAVGLEIDSAGCDFFVSGDDLQWADNFLKKESVVPGDKIIALNPGGNWLPKRWPRDNFSAIGKLFLSNYADARIIITGALKDVSLAGDINKALGGEVIITCGKASLKQTAAIFKRSSLVISNDSGPFHIAVSVGAKAIGIYGPTSPFLTGPYNADKSKVLVLYKKNNCNIPCYDNKCKNFTCMTDITPKEVFEAAQGLLK